MQNTKWKVEAKDISKLNSILHHIPKNSGIRTGVQVQANPKKFWFVENSGAEISTTNS